jgi:hypothetical protein
MTYSDLFSTSLLPHWWCNVERHSAKNYRSDGRLDVKSLLKILAQDIVHLSTVNFRLEMPLPTQSDSGTENNGIANAQTILCHRHDPSLAEALQPKFWRKKGNIKPEIAWRRLRDTWSAGYEDPLSMGVREGWYHPKQLLHRCIQSTDFSSSIVNDI